MSFKKVEQRVKFPELEKSTLEFWKKNKVFEKSVEERPKNKQFSFYDGPPYATNMPHFGNILAGLIKDVIPRYKTMQGYRVERIWGWDTHGLPIENIVEEKLGFKSRDEIHEYGVGKFNEKCRSQVFEYVEAWRDVIDRTGRWADMDNAYITMDKNYMESIWWVFSELWNKDLIYEGHKVMPYCPRCSTGLSSFEVSEGGYKDKTDKAVTIKFEVEGEKDTYFLAWTTTPWTLPGNLALTVGEGISYAIVESSGKKYILAADRVEDYGQELGKYKIKEKVKGKELVGKKYKAIFPYHKNAQPASPWTHQGGKAFEVISGDFVTTEDGTGIVHTAPAFGEDDSVVGQKFGIDFFMPVDELGKFTEDVPEYTDYSVIDPRTNKQIIKDLADTVFRVDDYNHPYPYCWRCDSPLIYRAIDSWFISIDKIRKDVLKSNKDVKWVPEHVGKGRYAKMVESAPDWNISRNRFWGVPLPVWKCECGEHKVYGNIKDLEKDSGKKIDDIHLHKIQDIKIDCKCGKKAELTGEILDVWFDSGSMPYGKLHYPFENKEQFEREFPTNFIAEGIDQTRGWFRSLMVLGTALFGKSPFENVVVNGTILTETGEKMSKSKKNFTDPMILMDQYGADAMRFYLMSSPAVKAEDMKFTDSGVDEVLKKVILRLWNSYSFFMMYASLDDFKPKGKLDSKNLLDKWMISKVNTLVGDVTNALENYDTSLGARHLSEFVDELSNWYIRRSRKRFWKSEDDGDKLAAYETLYYTLTTYIKLLAPYMPFVTEEMYQGLVVSQNKKAPKSIHLTEWPASASQSSLKTDEKLEGQMEVVRGVIETGLAIRNEKQIKVRQPLETLLYSHPLSKLTKELTEIIKEEVNVKNVKYYDSRDEFLSDVIKSRIYPLKEVFTMAGDTSQINSIGISHHVAIDVNNFSDIPSELKAEGIARDFMRAVQDGRKKADFNVEDRIVTNWGTNDKENRDAIISQADVIAKETLSLEFNEGNEKHEYDQTVKIYGAEVWFGISRKKIK